jgi:alkylated DNA nucleotide flippase Atl1
MQHNKPSSYNRIYEIILQIPRGKVTTYGQIARLAGNCTPRMVGYALAALPEGTDIPWQRVINHLGRISPRSHSGYAELQRQLLESECVRFNSDNQTDLSIYGWRPSQHPV